MPRSRCESRCRRLAEIARSFNLKLVYLFGSQSHLGARYLHGEDPHLSDPLADLDIGVVLMKDDMSPLERSDLYAALSAELQELFGPFTVDLVLLEETHSVLQSEAVCGECVYSADENLREAYEERVLARAADFKPFLDLFYRERLEERHDKSNPH
ncbi:MAG: nucleotidyltransferase domain-containing protein [Bacillota bacterium]